MWPSAFTQPVPASECTRSLYSQILQCEVFSDGFRFLEISSKSLWSLHWGMFQLSIADVATQPPKFSSIKQSFVLNSLSSVTWAYQSASLGVFCGFFL